MFAGGEIAIEDSRLFPIFNRKRGFFFTLHKVKRKNKKKKKITPLKQTSAEAHFQPFTPVGIAVNR